MVPKVGNGKLTFLFLQHLMFYGHCPLSIGQKSERQITVTLREKQQTVHELIIHIHYQLQLMSSFAGIKCSYLAAKAMGSPEDNRRVGANKII